MSSATVKGTRFSHNEGHTFLTYSPDGGSVLTCGTADGEVRVFKDFEDGEESSHLVGDEAFALACSASKFYSAASGTNAVQSFSLENGSSEGVVARFTADPTCVDVSVDGSFLAAGSEDMTVKVVRGEEGGAVTLEGHEGPVLSVAVDTAAAEERKYVLSSACDGTVRVWRVSGEGGVEVKSLHGMGAKCADAETAKSRVPVAWRPYGGALFALAASERVLVYARESWEEKRELPMPQESKEKEEIFTALGWSPMGNLLIAGTSKGNMHVFDWESRKVVASFKTGRGYAVTAAAWDPRDNGEAAFIDSNGWWGVAEDIAGGKTSAEDAPKKKEGQRGGVAKKAEDEMNEDELAAALFEDDDDENSFSIRKIKRDTGFLSEENSNSSFPPNKEEGAKDPAVPDAPSPMPPPPPVVAAPPPTVVSAPYEPDLQLAFQPSSTPSHLSSSFMVWNAVGLVRCISGGDDSAIEVEFHDTSVHHPLHISNALGHIMADLSSTCLALACPADEEGMAPSRLVVHNFAEQDREWSTEMPSKEEVMAVCCAERWVAAATDRRRLRLFTSGGMQRNVFSLPGPVVAMAGHADKLLVVVHGGTPLPGDQNMSYTILNPSEGDSRRMSAPYRPLPLAPRSELDWVGFSDEGVPCTKDTAGLVRLLSSGSGWQEVCDTNQHVKGKSDRHFVIGASVEELAVRTILCRGARYPQTVPRPTVGVVRMALPLCEPATEKSMLEEELLKQELNDAADVRAETNQTLMKLFALACKSEHDARALEVCRLMDTDTIQVAMKYATRIRRGGLANKLSELACDIQDKEESERMARCQSEDIFDDPMEVIPETQEEDQASSNPILAAKRKRMALAKPAGGNREDGDERKANPFKKSGKVATSGAIRSGIVFDDMNPQAPKAKTGGDVKEGFGARRIKIKATMDKSGGPKQSPASTGRQTTLFEKSTTSKGNSGKENVGNDTNGESSPQLKGFQLWLAENRDTILADNAGLDDSEVNAKGLESWKGMSKEEKDAYKTPRTPLSSGLNNKRKRDAPSSEDSLPTTSKRKLAEFAAPE